MNKIFEKIRYWLVGERTVTEKGELIAKDKKLTDNEKMEKLFDLYTKYLNSKQLKYDIELAIDELYYEAAGESYGNYIKIEKSVRGNFYYVICTQFVKQISNLKNIDKTLCTTKQNKVLEMITGISRSIYTPEFNYEKFYTNKEANEKLGELNTRIIEVIKKYGQNLTENQNNELW